jgi:hypothetical protein
MIVFDHGDFSRRGYYYRFRSGILVAPAVFADFIKIKNVMGVFDSPDAVTAFLEDGNQFFEKGGFASMGSTDDTNDGGHIVISKI